MTAEEYVEYKDRLKVQIDMLRDKIRAAYDEVDTALPADLRPATASDITPGRIIYYEHGDDGPFWQEVREVLRPNDQWKAYTAMDGCRYGLDDAWVRKEAQP